MKTGIVDVGKCSSNIPMPGLKSWSSPVGESPPSGNQTRFFLFFRITAPKARLERAARIGSTGKIFPKRLRKRITGYAKAKPDQPPQDVLRNCDQSSSAAIANESR